VLKHDTLQLQQRKLLHVVDSVVSIIPKGNAWSEPLLTTRRCPAESVELFWLIHEESRYSNISSNCQLKVHFHVHLLASMSFVLSRGILRHLGIWCKA